MTTLNIRRSIAAALMSASLLTSITASAQGEIHTTTVSSQGVNSEEIITMTATVTAVDQKARTVTLKGADGGEVTMAVGEEVKRLAEVKVGDQLDIGYLQSIGLEFREATPEEVKNPLTETIQTERADKTQAPAGGQLRTIRAVVTLEGMSRWLETLTVRGPRGNYFVVEVDPGTVKWEDLRIGQTMVGTYTEAMVMSIEHAAKK